MLAAEQLSGKSGEPDGRLHSTDSANTTARRHDDDDNDDGNEDDDNHDHDPIDAEDIGPFKHIFVNHLAIKKKGISKAFLFRSLLS